MRKSAAVVWRAHVATPMALTAAALRIASAAGKSSHGVYLAKKVPSCCFGVAIEEPAVKTARGSCRSRDVRVAAVATPTRSDPTQSGERPLFLFA